MRKVRWGVLGTADIARGQTIPGMQLAEHCELYAIAGRKLEKAKLYQEEFGFQKAYAAMMNCWQIRRWKRFIFRCPMIFTVSGRLKP